jgi:excisionase family DNA binding protein
MQGSRFPSSADPQENTNSNNLLGRTMEILNAPEVAAMLKISTRQVYELAKEKENPIPSFRMRSSVRFRKSDVEKWIAELVERKAA